MPQSLSVLFAVAFPALTETPLKLSGRESLSLFHGLRCYERENFRFNIDKPISAQSCSPPTPSNELDGYTATVNNHAGQLAGIVNSLNNKSLHMAAFAQAVNSYGQFLQSIPNSFCIGPSNQSNFDALNQAINNTGTIVQRGVSIYEANLDQFASSCSALLNQLIQACNAISSSSRDFRQVLSSLNQYQTFVSGYNIEIWNLSSRIQALAQNLDGLTHSADTGLTNAIAQIETNVEADAQTIVQQGKNCEDAFRIWEKVNGKDGYNKYMDTARFTAKVLVPQFNDFLQKVPGTNRVKAAVQRAQQSLDYIATNINSFPDFRPLPVESASFPHLAYGSAEKQFGGDRIIGILQSACVAHLAASGNKLNIGNMQWEHGGYMDPHRSHKEGRDADLVASEVGIVPDHDAARALAAVKEFLTAGAALVLFADQTVVNDANTWAQQNGISGRASYEASHTDHFHLRAPL